MFDGENLYVDIELTLDESIKEGGVTKEIVINRSSVCTLCNGKRASSASKSHPCHSCNSKGIKIDPLFNREIKCAIC